MPILLSRDQVEPGSEDSCLRAIVRTGSAELDALNDALTRASAEDMALFAIAMMRKQQAAERPSET